MPLCVVLLLEADAIGAGLCADTEVLELDRRNGADLGVVTAQVTARVKKGVDMKRGILGTTRQLAQTQHELLLDVICEVVLGTEEDYATL